MCEEGRASEGRLRLGRRLPSCPPPPPLLFLPPRLPLLTPLLCAALPLERPRIKLDSLSDFCVWMDFLELQLRPSMIIFCSRHHSLTPGSPRQSPRAFRSSASKKWQGTRYLAYHNFSYGTPEVKENGIEAGLGWPGGWGSRCRAA